MAINLTAARPARERASTTKGCLQDDPQKPESKQFVAIPGGDHNDPRPMLICCSV